MKNTGKDSEKIFIDAMQEMGLYVHRLRDSQDVNGLNKHRKGRIAMFPCPSDFIIARKGYYELAEIKSVTSSRSFTYSMVRPAQRAAATVAASIGSPYNFYIHDKINDIWYVISAKQFIDNIKAGKKSSKFEELDLCLLT